VRRPPSRVRGMSLIEIVVASAILSVLALAMLTATVSLTRSTNVATVALDLDRDADRFLAEFRREVRTSGYFKFAGTVYPQLWVGGAANAGEEGTSTSLRLRRRTGGDPYNGTLAQCAAMWTPAANGNTWIEYAAVSDGAFGNGTAKLKVVRRFADPVAGTTVRSTDVLNNVQSFSIKLIPPGGASDLGAQNTMALVEVDLRLSKVDPSRTDKVVLTSRQYLERMRAQNAR
jgi:prepilin-type N-terminal cleavage/methylation domain-containing protein